MNKKIVGYFLFFAFLIILWLGYNYYKQRERQKVVEQCKMLQLGMSKEDVGQITGYPTRKEEWEYDGLVKESWYFKASSVVSEPPRCIFNKKTGKVIEIICGENYRIK